MRLNRKVLFAMLVALITPPTSVGAQAPSQAATAQADEPLHVELRAIKQRLVDGVNKKDGPALFAEMSPGIVFTAMNNDHVRGMAQVQAYYAKMMVGAEKIINDMSITADADDLSQLYANNSIAIATGVSKAHFDVRGGLVFDIPLRWTATFERSTGQWKIAALHFSANPVDNPILSGATAFWKWIGAGAAVLALILGFLLGRRKRSTA